MIKFLPSHIKYSWNIKKKISGEVSQGEQTIINFLHVKTTEVEKSRRTFSQVPFHPGHPWPKTLVSCFTGLNWCLNTNRDHYF